MPSRTRCDLSHAGCCWQCYRGPWLPPPAVDALLQPELQPEQVALQLRSERLTTGIHDPEVLSTNFVECKAIVKEAEMLHQSAFVRARQTGPRYHKSCY